MSFPDHFTAGAQGYARYRPGYPAGLFQWLANLCPGRTLAWDCATGSGQAAVPLAEFFGRVVATDASLGQLREAAVHPRVCYAAATGEAPPLRDRAADLITVAQALHWLDLGRFFPAVRRCLAPGGVFATWTYGLCRISEAVDPLVQEFHDVTVGPYWPAERWRVIRGYQGVELPFDPITPPRFAMAAEWDLSAMTGYLRTWSGVARYRQATGVDPVASVLEGLRERWGDETSTRRIEWPLTILAGRNSPDA